MAAARPDYQAVGVCHIGAHALGAAAYAAMAAGVAQPDRPEAVEDEVRRHLGHMSAAVRRLGPGHGGSRPMRPATGQRLATERSYAL